MLEQRNESRASTPRKPASVCFVLAKDALNLILRKARHFILHQQYKMTTAERADSLKFAKGAVSSVLNRCYIGNTEPQRRA